MNISQQQTNAKEAIHAGGSADLEFGVLFLFQIQWEISTLLTFKYQEGEILKNK